MNQKGAFTLSLDCEGLWGMADQAGVVSGGAINHAALREAYEFIAQALQENQLRCSAAFVTAFAAGAGLVREHLPLVRELAGIVPSWYAHVLPALERGNFDGWDGQALFRLFAQDGHEMAWHGATHLPLESATPDAAVKLELQLGASLLSAIGCKPTSVVFPRNRVGHLRMLQQAGFETYRAERSSGKVAKLAGLAREWAIFDQRVGERPYRHGYWFVSPPGDFLNWPARVRAAIPPSVTVMRWKSMLRAAAERQGYVHMWFHPHNLITAPAMKRSFLAIVEDVARWVRSGDIVVLTMAEANRHFTDKTAGAST